VKVRASNHRQPALGGRVLIILSFSFVLLLSVFASSAGAITRAEVLSRASSWIKRRVPYSQHGYHAGYRRDCSGFVSMAWKLDKSYSSRSIGSRARRVSISALKPGDAVLTPGHVAIFAGWKNRARREYIAVEQTTWGGHARRHVRSIPRRATALRRRGISDANPRLLAARKAAARRAALRLDADIARVAAATPVAAAACSKLPATTAPSGDGGRARLVMLSVPVSVEPLRAVVPATAPA